MSSDNTDDVGNERSQAESQLDGSYPSPSSGTPKFQSKRSSPATPEDVSAIVAQPDMREKTSIGSFFAIPPPLKRLFDKFPLVTYSENLVPGRATKRRNRNTLYIFTTQEHAANERLSFNPSCLKWQIYLTVTGIPHMVVSSNNHASPSGSLPFLSVPPKQVKGTLNSEQVPSAPQLLHGNRLKRWIEEQNPNDIARAEDDVRYEAYSSLIDNAIRKAWLYQLYMNPNNATVAKRLYIDPCSSNPLVQMTIASQLRSAAQAEIVKASPQNRQWTRIDEAELVRDADEAFKALSTLLGDANWFFAGAIGEKKPAGRASLFDASVFAYTHLIVDKHNMMAWEDNRLAEVLQKYENLVRHRDRILDLCY